MSDGDWIYKICSRDEWNEAAENGFYRGSADDARDGYIHFSRAHQVAGTLAKYFHGRDDLVLVTVDAGKLGAALRNEPSRGDDLFPHLYAPLAAACAHAVRALPWDGTQHALPSDL